MARELISKNATKSVYRDGDKAVKVFCKGFPKAEVLNEALISARVEAIGGINIHIQNLVAAACPDFIRREPGGAILSVCKILTGIPSVCAVRLDAFQKRPIIRGKRIILVPHRIKSAKGNFQQILVLFAAHELMGLHDMFFDQTPNVLIHMDGYTGADE